MSKSKLQYSRTTCGALSPKWAGQCGECGEWNTMVEAIAATKAHELAVAVAGPSATSTLMAIERQEAVWDFTPDGYREAEPEAATDIGF